MGIALGSCLPRGLPGLLVATALTALAAGCGNDEPKPLGAHAKSRDFTVYYAGDSFAGNRLRPQEDGNDAERRPRSVDFLYGDCEPPEGEGGCALPLEIENEHACGRTGRRQGRGAERHLRIRGAPAAVFGENDLLEVYTGDATVRIHADGDLLVMRRAADALRSVDGRVGPHDRLPPPDRRSRC
jgi:hypothetical protein